MHSAFPNIVGFVLLAISGCAFAAGPAPVLLGTAANFAVLAETGVSSVPNSAVSGNVGVSPATITSVTGFSLVQDVSKQFWTSTQVKGRVMGSTDALPTPGLLTTAVLDMQAAYTDASNRPGPNFVGLKAGLIGGSVLTPGLYKWTTGVTISTGITISGGPADTWIFQISGTLVQAANVHITLIGGALSQNIIWVVAGTVTVGTDAVFEGNILAKTNVVIGTNAIDNGCIYAQTAVALQQATVLCSGGTVAPPPPSSSASSSTVSSTSATVSSSTSATVSSTSVTVSSSKSTSASSSKTTVSSSKTTSVSSTPSSTRTSSSVKQSSSTVKTTTPYHTTTTTTKCTTTPYHTTTTTPYHTTTTTTPYHTTTTTTPYHTTTTTPYHTTTTTQYHTTAPYHIYA